MLLMKNRFIAMHIKRFIIMHKSRFISVHENRFIAKHLNRFITNVKHDRVNFVLVQNGVVELVGDEDEEDGVDRELVDEESTDSMVSASQILPSFGLARQPELDSRSPFLVKRVSNTSGARFYQARTSPPPPPAPPGSGRDGSPTGRGKLYSFITSLLSPHSLFLSLLTLLLFLILCTSCYLVFRLDSIQDKVEAFLPSYPGNLEQISTWQKILHSQSSIRVDEYLQNNLHQLAKVFIHLYITFKQTQTKFMLIPFKDGYASSPSPTPLPEIV